VRDSFWVFCLRARPSGTGCDLGRVVDENGAASPERAWNCGRRGRRSRGGLFGPGRQLPLELPAAGEYAIRAERLALSLPGHGQRFDAASTQLTITLNHQQEFRNGSMSRTRLGHRFAAALRSQGTLNAEIQAIPYPRAGLPHALPMMDGVVQDNAGRAHFNGGDHQPDQLQLDGFNVSDPVTGRLEARVNIETIQSWRWRTAASRADNGRGSAGVLDLTTRWATTAGAFGVTNFFPGSHPMAASM